MPNDCKTLRVGVTRSVEKNALKIRITASMERLKIERDRVASEELDTSVLQALSAEIANVPTVRDKWREQLNTVNLTTDQLANFENERNSERKLA